ncbi:MAG TPA: NAD(P)-binding domain-containing protein, partial [Sphingobacterium sp.]|nr:NAD(P)-binding domain-containing protein [Sphingobacterium sp.]
MKKITIIGSGNIGFSLAKGLVKSNKYKAGDITLTRRSLSSLYIEKEQGFDVSDNNIQAIKGRDIIVLCILPQQARKVMEQIAPHLHPGQVFISVVSGLSCADMREVIGTEVEIVRAMPNTAIAIGESMTCISSDKSAGSIMQKVEDIFESVGAV